MPMTDEELNQYQAQQNEASDEAARASLHQLGIGTNPLAAQSATSTLNKYNQARQGDYLRNLAARQELARNWQETAIKKAQVQAAAEAEARAHQRGLEQLSLQKQRDIREHELAREKFGFEREVEPRKLAAQEEQIAEAARANRAMEEQRNWERQRLMQEHQELLLQRQKEAKQLRKKHLEDLAQKKLEFSASEKHATRTELMHKAQQIYNMMLSKRQMKHNEWVDQTNAMLKGMGLQLSADPIEYAKQHPELATGAINREQGLGHLANILSTLGDQTRSDKAMGLAGLNAKRDHELAMLNALGNLKALTLKQQNLLFQTILGAGTALATHKWGE
jgi:hypothetical protein